MVWLQSHCDYRGYCRLGDLRRCRGCELHHLRGPRSGRERARVADIEKKLESTTDSSEKKSLTDELAHAKTEKEEAEKVAHGAVTKFFGGYLTGYIFWMSLPLGGMSLLMIHYLAKSSWGRLLTRPLEAATRTLPLSFVFFLPLAGAVAMHEYSPYWWSHPGNAEHKDISTVMSGEPGDKREQTLEEGKRAFNNAITHQLEAERKEREEGIYGFLSAPAFIGVGVVLFLIWGVLIFFLNKWSKEASDSNDPRVVDRKLQLLSNISGPGLIIFAITTTAAATHWVMSLEPGWSSTMFPVIYAVNQFLTCFAFCLSLFLLWASRPPFVGHMRPKFQLDMGTLLLAFTLVWSYTSYSQFMLVWIGNLPEEIPFFLKRSNYEHQGKPFESFWWCVSARSIALHFAIPFLLLLFRNVKLHPVRLRLVATYLVIICMVDVIWWIAPAEQHPGHFPSWLVDIGAILGVGGLWGLYFIYQLKQRPLFPDNQAFLLPEGHHHGQH